MNDLAYGRQGESPHVIMGENDFYLIKPDGAVQEEIWLGEVPAPDPAWSVEKEIWAQALTDAVKVLIYTKRTTHEGDIAYMRELRWFASTRYFTGSFEWICELLDLDPSAVRARVAVIVEYRRQGNRKKRGVR